MANKKVVSVLSTAAIGTLIATAVGSTVFAAVDGLVVKNAAGAYLNYDLDALKASVVNDALGQAGAELYKDFDAARTAGSIASYHDNKVGFVDAASVQKAALDAALAGTNFALDTFTESSKETVLPATVYQATVTNGKVVAGAEVKPTSTPVSTSLAVESVSAINLHQIQVVFSTEVDKTTAERISNYTFGSATINSAVLQADNKTVVINLYQTSDDTAALAQNTEYTLTVENVKNKALTATVEKVAKTFKAADSAIPTVKSVEVLGNKTLRVTFSEPVKATQAETVANYGFIGEAVTIASVALDKNTVAKESYTSALVSLTDTLTPGDHKFRVNGTGAIVDFAAFSVVPQDFTVTVPVDSQAPTVASVVATSRTEAEITFSEGVSGLAATDVLWNTNGSLTSGYAADSVTKLADNKYKATFTTSVLPAGNVSVVVTNANVKDYSNNPLAAASKTDITVAAENKAKVTAVVAKTDKVFEVYFDKNVKIGGTSDSSEYEANYKFLKSDGTALTNSDNASLNSAGNPASAAAAVWSATEKKVTITLANEITGGSYKLKISGVKDLVGQTVDEQTIDFNVKDTTAPAVAGTPYNASASTLIIYFNEPMATTGANSITDPANYRVNLASNPTVTALPAGTTLTAASNAKSVTIKLPTAYAFATNDDIEIGYLDAAALKTVADASGNLFTPNAASLANIAVSAAQVDISSSTTLKVTSPTTLELTLPTAAAKLASVEANDFKITKTNAASFALAEVNVQSAALDSTGKKVTLTVADTTADRFTPDSLAGVGVYIDSTAANIDSKDVLGLKLASNVFKAVDSNDIKPTIKSAALIDTANLRLTFDSKIDGDATYVNNLTKLAEDLIIVQGDKSYTGADLTVTTVPSATDSVVLNVALGAGKTFDLSKDLTVKTVAQDLVDAKGANGALLAANTTGVVVSATNASLAVDSIVFNDLTNDQAIENNGTIVITFNRNVDAASIKALWNGATTTITDLIAIDNAANTITFNGANIGTIKTAGINIDATLDGTIAVDGKVLTITITEAPAANAVTAGTSTFTVDSNIKSTAGSVVNTDVKANTNTDF